MQDQTQSPFHRFHGRRMLILIAVFMAYTLWYIGPGFFGDLTRLAGHTSLQKSGFYTGAEAVERLGKLDGAGRKTKFLALIFDVPYMILQALVFEAFIAFGMRHIKPKSPNWNFLFILPIGFLLVDFAEDSFIALTMTTGSTVLGTIAGFMTALKFAIFFPAIIVAFLMGVGGLIFWLRHRKHS